MRTHENLEKLLSQFMDPQEAGKAADEIRAGDHLFDRYPVCPVTELTLQRVRRRVARRSRLQRLFAGLSFAGSAAAAAAIVFAVLYGFNTRPVDTTTSSRNITVASAPQQKNDTPVLSPEKSEERTVITENLWNRLASHESLVQIDRELADVAESINAIESEPYGEFVNTLKIDLLELEELELLTANSDFWKG